MDKNDIETIIKGLKSTSSTRIQDTLLKIKNNVITSSQGLKTFRDCGGLHSLLPLLRKPNERMLNTTLSILGNCCIDEESSLMVGKSNIFRPLISILKTVYRDSILGRTCRLIGNLAQRHSNAKGLHDQGAVEVIVALIENRDNNTSIATLTMAVRAIRQLWMVTDKREEMLSVNAVKCVAVLLTVQCESAGILDSPNPISEVEELGKSQEELINGILKCLGYFTTYSNKQCAEQIQGDGRGYKCLVALTKLFESTALKCLTNLCHITYSLPLLGTAGFVECLVEILQKLSDVSWWPEGSGKALALLSSDSLNRLRIRECDGLALLISAARVNTNVMHSFIKYYFDSIAFEIFVNVGLINLLTEKLNEHVSTMDIEHKKRWETDKYNSEPNLALLKMIEGSRDSIDRYGNIRSKNKPVTYAELVRSRRNNYVRCEHKTDGWLFQVLPSTPDPNDLYPLSPCSDMNQSGPASPEYGPARKKMRYDWSPESSVSAGEGSSASPYWADWSPQSSSSPTSPLSISEDSADSEISGRYSPVCSEPEADGSASKLTANKLLNLEASEVDHDSDELDTADDKSEDDQENSQEDDDDDDDDNHNVVMNFKLTDIGCVFILLLRVASKESLETENEIDPDDKIYLLSRPDCFNGLLNYVERSNSTFREPSRLLKRIASSPLSFMNVLKERFPLRLYNTTQNSKHPRNECSQCVEIFKLYSKLLARLTIMAESSYGIGEICYQLQKGSPDVKQTITITLPFLVCVPNLLKKYFIDCNALTMLLTIISESSEDSEIAIAGLIKLANNLNIKDPRILQNRYKDKVSISYDPILDNLLDNDIVTFELDDLSTVRANKLFLCQNSEVFTAMLKGCFMESGKSCVRLRQATKSALEYLFTLLQNGLNDPKSEVVVFPTETLEICLEALLLADRFLFETLKDMLISGIVQFCLCPESVERIYTWSLSDGMGFLSVEVTSYLLMGEMSKIECSRFFTNILSSKYKDQCLNDIKSMLTRELVKY
ncbi:PREDICTED: armadillo repeat-containing protein 5 isoform X2 [Papilio polytes]|uniref:armadillo repeat-containing protein 5 isoform X2 n=1 Tax=Papilio polytes TaxID=76194 RepID=UPI0006765DDE|nr:PREDICTED: armadillo repeat-containing protein 5 isoform X2 [Papilio polytes]